MSPIITVPHPLLRQKSKPVGKVTPAIIRLIKDLKKTLETAEDPQGVGLSAVQIGRPVRLFLARKTPADKPIVFINPEITWGSDEMTDGIPSPVKGQKPARQPSQARRPGSKVNGQRSTACPPAKPGEATRVKGQVPEGCLSIPGYFGLVHRHQKIKMNYSTLVKGLPASQARRGGQGQLSKVKGQEFSEFLSTVIQHEVDHLNGILFIDRVLKQGGKLYKEEKNELVETNL